MPDQTNLPLGLALPILLLQFKIFLGTRNDHTDRLALQYGEIALHMYHEIIQEESRKIMYLLGQLSKETRVVIAPHGII